MKTIFIVLLTIFLTGCLCSKHHGTIVTGKIQGKKHKTYNTFKNSNSKGDTIEYNQYKHIHTFNYIVLKEKDNSTTIKKISPLRLKYHKINKPICYDRRKEK